MQSINALSLAPDANDWLANSRYPRILHVFDCACNLINEHREVLSIVTQEIGNGPFNLVIEEDVLFSECLSLQSLISNSPNHLYLGDLSINTEKAKLWPPRPAWETLHANRDQTLNQIMLLREWCSSARSNLLASWKIASLQGASALLTMTSTQLPITNYPHCGGFDTSLDDYSGLLNHRQLTITQSPDSNLQFSNSLLFALANADLPSSLTAARKLAGLGNGLTPAGDDFIMGAVLAAWIIHPSDAARVLAEEVTKAAAPLTTSLSGAWLRSAGRGEAGILWHQFFDALLTGDPFSVQLKITKLLSMGHTSGADALSGFVGTLLCWAEVAGATRPVK